MESSTASMKESVKYSLRSNCDFQAMEGGEVWLEYTQFESHKACTGFEAG